MNRHRKPLICVLSENKLIRLKTIEPNGPYVTNCQDFFLETFILICIANHWVQIDVLDSSVSFINVGLNSQDWLKNTKNNGSIKLPKYFKLKNKLVGILT